jgi:DNA anti-recombination protein RmuC
MNIRTLPRIAIRGSLFALRTPLSLAASALPGGEGGARDSARLAVERLDVSLLDTVARVTLDRDLAEEARLKRVALAERERATRLRANADREQARAEQELAERREQAERLREGADRRAEARRNAAEERRSQRQNAAAKVGQQRRQTNRGIERAHEQRVEEQAKQARLEALDKKLDALDERQEAIAERQEAERLAGAAARAKEERKTS